MQLVSYPPVLTHLWQPQYFILHWQEKATSPSPFFAERGGQLLPQVLTFLSLKQAGRGFFTSGQRQDQVQSDRC